MGCSETFKVYCIAFEMLIIFSKPSIYLFGLAHLAKSMECIFWCVSSFS